MITAPQPSVEIQERGCTHKIRIVQGMLETVSETSRNVIGITSVPLSTDTARDLAALFAGYVALQEICGVKDLQKGRGAALESANLGEDNG